MRDEREAHVEPEDELEAVQAGDEDGGRADAENLVQAVVTAECWEAYELQGEGDEGDGNIQHVCPISCGFPHRGAVRGGAYT